MKNNMIYYDTHAHYGFSYRKTSFYENRHEILKLAYENGIQKVVNVGIDMPSNYAMLKDFTKEPWVRIAIGEHPNCVGTEEDPGFRDHEKDEQIRTLCNNPQVCAIKTGLDYSKGKENRIRQKKRFRELIRISRNQNLPLVLHIRDAWEDALQILEEESAEGRYRGVIHCFVYEPKVAWKFIEKGFLLGIGGKVTYESNGMLRESVENVPLKYLVLETDAPFIPICGSKEVNSSMDIPKIAEIVAKIKGISVEEVAKVTYQNAVDLFG